MPKPPPQDRHPECMYHGIKHKANYNQIVNLVRDRTDPKKPNLPPPTNPCSFIIQRKYNRKISKAVCICKNGPQDVGSQLDKVKGEIEAILLADQTLKPIHNTLRRYIDKVQATSSKKPPKENLLKMQNRSSSQLRFFQVLLEAKQGKYEFLEHLPKKDPAPAAAAGEDPLRLFVSLDMKQSHLGLLIGKKGENLKKIRTEFDVEITIVQPEKTKNTGLTSHFPDMTSKEIVRVIIMGKDKTKNSAAKEKLIQRATEINANRQVMTERTEKWKADAPERKKMFAKLKEDGKKKKEAEEAAAAAMETHVPEEKLTTAVQPSGE